LTGGILIHKNLYMSLKESSKSDDFIQATFTIHENILHFTYFTSVVNHEQFHHDLLSFFHKSHSEFRSIDELKNLIPLEEVMVSSNLEEISLNLIKGFIYIQMDSNLDEGLLVNIADTTKGYRPYNDSQNEYSVVGPKVAFVEDLDTNLNLLRKGLVSEKLIFEEHIIGSISKTRIAIVSMEGITNTQHINTARQRLLDLDIDVIYDSSFLDQIIADNSNTPFPLFVTTERIDRIKYALVNGQVVLLCNGAPYAISGPATVYDFFTSPEDYYLSWVLSSFFRLTRYIGILFSIFASSIYVAVLTFHYTIIPKSILGPLIESRVNVPFPPFLEVFFLEVSVEMLREAGARLPTKIGQTLGIVGGVVLGQAAVQAGLTSSILIIIVSLSALASFTIPIFKMSNTLRFLRFPLMFLAYYMGGLGLMIGVVFLLGHLMQLKSLGSPYIVPLYPFRIKEFGDSIIRSSLSILGNRPRYLRPLHVKKFNVQKNKDIGDDYNNE
jgi:hypothetical protein